MNKLIKEKCNNIAKAAFRIARAYPKSFYCSDLSLILQKVYETIVLYSNKDDSQFPFEYIYELMGMAFKELEYIEKEGIVAPINTIILRKNINHTQSLLRFYFNEIHMGVSKGKNELLGKNQNIKPINNVDIQEKNSELIFKEENGSTPDLSPRQNAILALFLENQHKAMQLKDIMIRFPDLSDRTIRSDLAQLVRIGKIEQKGFGRGSFYSKSY